MHAHACTHACSRESNELAPGRPSAPSGLDGGSFYPYVVATIIATAISTVFMVLPLVVAPSRVDLDKSSAYECGFDAFGEVCLAAAVLWGRGHMRVCWEGRGARDHSPTPHLLLLCND